MDWKDITPLIAKLAPSVAAALGGPLAGNAISALESVFGLTPEGDTKTRQDALVGAVNNATADQLLAIKKADQDFQVRMAELGFKNIETIESLAVSDRDSARKREMEVKDKTPRNLAYLITLGFFTVLGVLMFGKVPDGTKEVLYIMLGTLGTSWTACINYFFGSTNGSAEKSKLLAQAEPPKTK